MEVRGSARTVQRAALLIYLTAWSTNRLSRKPNVTWYMYVFLFLPLLELRSAFWGGKLLEI